MKFSIRIRILARTLVTSLVIFGVIIGTNDFLDDSEVSDLNLPTSTEVPVLEIKSTVSHETVYSSNGTSYDSEVFRSTRSGYVPVNETSSANVTKMSSGEQLRREVLRANQEEKIRNMDKFDLITDESGIVVVVQVHNRSEYLRHLVESLRRSKGIEKVLLIFSRDAASTEVDELIDSVDFCLVMQIFYPFSSHLYPTEFPGNDPRDCPKSVDKERALKIGCQNALNPDTFGHYREAAFAQIKHHWFWKVNYIFDHLTVTKYFDGTVLFLEEDNYVLDDFLHVLRLMWRFKNRLCADCDLMVVGGYDQYPKSAEELSQVDIKHWVTNKHNIGMAMDRKAWRKIKGCGKAFCYFDDYNWDWSLYHISIKCLKNRLKALTVRAPRIQHIGECGVHVKKANCSPLQRMNQIKNFLQKHQTNLFPRELTVGRIETPLFGAAKMNGGWGDPRDHELCTSFLGESLQ